MLKKISSVILFVMIILSLSCPKVTLAIGAKPCLQITKTLDNNKPYPGDVVNFVYQVTNIGNAELYNVSVTENLIDQNSITPASVTKLMPGETVVFYGRLTIPTNATVGSVISNSAVASGFCGVSKIATRPCTLSFTICGQPVLTLPIVNTTNYINTTNYTFNYSQNYTFDYTPTLPGVTIPTYPYLPGTGEGHKFLFWLHIIEYMGIKI